MLVQLVKDKLGYKYYWVLFDYLQCLVCYVVLKVDVEQVYVVGKVVVDYVLVGMNVVMLVIVCMLDVLYCWKVEFVLLVKIVNKEKKMFKGFIWCDGFGIIEVVWCYFLLLIVGEVFLFW